MAVYATRGGHSKVRFELRSLRTMASGMLRALALPFAELSLVLTDDPEIRALNRAHRHKDRPTDVLAFSQNEDEHGRFVPFDAAAPVLLGDVVISLDTAAAQARAHGLSLVHELSLLLAHGLLHLLGCDHQNDHEERRMKARTQLLAAAGRAALRSRDSRRDLPMIGPRSPNRGQKTPKNRGGRR